MRLYPFISIFLLLFLYFMQKNRPSLKKYLIIANILISILYFVWRFTVVPTDSPFSLFTGILLLTAEFLGLLQFINLQVLFTKPYVLKEKTLHSYQDSPPVVDILICTYNESATLLEKTILCALNLNYPKDHLHIFVCDDGHREEIQSLCKTYEIGYLTRENNQGAKAGNLNHALLHTKAELFAVLDADMLCTENFLQRTVGYFSDSNVAFVQTPQVYYNKDMYQHNLNKEDIPNEQDFFMRDIQTGRAAFNAVLHVGTNAVFRRSCVMEIGMYPTNSITEDMAVGMLLQSKGYRTVFVNEPLVLGISVTNYTDLAIQRDRWCRGNLQVIGHFNPFFRKGLNLFQKLIYFDGTLYWFTSFQKMIFLLCPVLFLLTGVRALNADLPRLFFFFLPYILGSLLIFRAIAPDSRNLRWAHIYEIAMAPHTCASIIRQLFGRRTEFRVTPKESRDDRSYFQFQVILPHLVLAVLTLLAWSMGTYFLSVRWISFSAFLLNLFWSVYNMLGILLCIRVARHTSQKRPRQFTTVNGCDPMELKMITSNHTLLIDIISLSQTGLLFRPITSPKKGAQLLFDHSSLNAILKLPYRNEIIKISGAAEKTEKENVFYFSYSHLSPKEKQALMSLYMEHLRPVYPALPKQRYSS